MSEHQKYSPEEAIMQFAPEGTTLEKCTNGNIVVVYNHSVAYVEKITVPNNAVVYRIRNTDYSTIYTYELGVEVGKYLKETGLKR